MLTNFRPELDLKFKWNKAHDISYLLLYLFRICPGRHIAVSSLYLSIASILSVFRLEKALDENGHPITPSKEYISALILCAVPIFYLI
jgi:hypothetical protein